MNISAHVRRLIAAGVYVIALTGPALAQTTAFTYQGKLTDAGAAANGIFDFEFRLFDAAVAGSQVGSTVSHDNVPVTNGIFSVVLDFGSSAFSGSNRFLEVAVRAGAGTGGFTPLAPLHPMTSTPYSIRSLRAGTADAASSANALVCSGCVTGAALAAGSVTDAKITDVAGTKITGSVPVAAIPGGSASYIQNGVAQQPASFTITGTGTAADFAYVKAQTSYYAVNEAAFTARDGSDVSKGFGAGGAYPTASTFWGLVAPVNLPHGAAITNVRFIYVDNATTSLTLNLSSHDMVFGYSLIASHVTAVETATVQTVDVPVSPARIVDNTLGSLQVLAHPSATWMGSSMQVRGVVITYTMSRAAR